MRALSRLAVFTFVLATLAAVAAPAFAATAHDDDPRSQIVITGSVDVRPNQTVRRVLIFDGDVRVDGRVDDWVFAFHGDVTVSGHVGGSVTALTGRVVVTQTGTVGGDVVSSDPPLIARRSSVEGDVARARRRFALGRLGAVGRIVLWIAASLSSFLLGAVLLLVAPRGAEAAARAGRTAVGPAIGLGVAVAVGLPVLGVLVSLTIVGLPLGLATLFALALLFGLAYVAGCFFLGRLMIKEPRSAWLAFLVGWAILRVVGIVPVLGVLALLAASVYGAGCLTVAVFRARAGGARADDAVAEPPPPPAPASAPAAPAGESPSTVASS